MSDFQVTVKEAGDVVVLTTDGYLNNIGGEKISVKYATVTWRAVKIPF